MRRKKSRGGLRIFWLGAGAVLLLAIFAAIGVSLWAGQYLRGPAFRAVLERETGKALDAEVRVDPLAWTGAAAFTEELDAVGNPGSPIRKLTASQVRASVDWRAALDGTWRVDGIEALDVEAEIGPSGTRARESEPTSSRGASVFPGRFELGPVRAKRASVRFHRAEGDPIFLKDSRVELRQTGPSLEFDGHGGELLVGHLPPIRLTSFASRISREVFYLTDARGILPNGGKLSASGEFGKTSKWQVTWKEVDVAEIIHPPWKGRLTGRLEGHATMTSGTGVPTANGQFRLTEGLLQNLETLDQVAEFTKSPQFRRMPLQEVSGKFSVSGTGWNVQNFVLESKGLLKATGQIQVSVSGDMEGLLEVGVSPQVLRWIPGSRERVFTDSRDGYVWTPVRLGGTLDDPKEDLSVRLAVAARDEVIETGAKVLTSPAEAVIDGARGVLDSLAPLLD